MADTEADPDPGGDPARRPALVVHPAIRRRDPRPERIEQGRQIGGVDEEASMIGRHEAGGDRVVDPAEQAVPVAIDPEQADPGYWHRLHRMVMNAASAELARRRRALDATVSEVVLSWWRTLVPTAAMAAALAAFLLLRQPPSAPVAYVDVDEMLMEGIDGPVMPAFETASDDGGIIEVNEVF